MDQLAEYSVPAQRIEHGSRTGAVILSTDPPPTIADADVQAAIQQELTADAAVPQRARARSIRVPPTRSHGHPGQRRVLLQLLRLSQRHQRNDLLRGDAVPRLHRVPRRAAVARRSDLDELARALRSDHRSDTGQGWYDDQNGEIGDICAWKTRRLGSYAVQLVVQQRGPLRVTSPIKHVVIIVKENHGLRQLLRAVSRRQRRHPAHSPNPPPKDPNHRHAAWLTRDTTAAHVQFQEKDIRRYWEYARQFTLCDNYYTDVAGPRPEPPHADHGRLSAHRQPDAQLSHKPGPALYDQPSLPAQLDAAGLSWGNYAGYAFEFIKYTAGKQRRWQQFAADAAAGKLPTVSWLYADQAFSEHPADTPAERASGAATSPKAASGPRARCRPSSRRDSGRRLRSSSRGTTGWLVGPW